MAIQLQLRRGTEAENNTFVGAVGEVTVDTTNDTLRLHDGETLGGISIDKSVNVVHKAGAEEITGAKTFDSTVKLKSTNIDTTTSPLADEEFVKVTSTDSNNTECGSVGMTRTSDNKLVNTISAHRVVNNVDRSCEVSVIVDPQGNPSTNAPTPSATNSTDNGNIATVGWVNDSTKSTNVVHRDSSETISGEKTFTTSPILPTPNVTDNSTLAATTAYVNAKMQIVSAIPASGTAGVIYFVYS